MARRLCAHGRLVLLAAALSLPDVVSASQDEVELLRSDSRTPYVHRIALYDHDGEVIDPGDEFAGPYSPRTTCAKCHDYGEISHGWHFNASDESVPPGRPGEPWFLVDPQTGTQLPISGRQWAGTYTPTEAGLTNWQFVMTFGHHTPGGGFGEPSDERVKDSPKRLRWGVSGKLEIDCMFCHSADQQHDPAEAARQIERENFRWSPTAALGLAVIRGEARKAPDDWDPLMEPDPDFPERAGPKLVWDLSRFDADNRVLFNLVRRPPADRCYFCHSFRQVGRDASDEILASQDVHLAAGLTCVDCHRHEIDHMMVRGYENEAAERGEPELATFSCKGCHLGVEGATDPLVALGGRYGAPHPEHRGLPPAHFDKLTCTACHSGPWPEMNAKRFQTALAHGLGLPTRERTDGDPPHIVGPIFARQHDGKIAPQRMIWPRFWGRWLDSQKDFELASPRDICPKIANIVSAWDVDDLVKMPTLSSEQIENVLVGLTESGTFASPLFVQDGAVHSLSPRNELRTSGFAGVAWAVNQVQRKLGTAPDQFKAHWRLVQPYRWSIAHNVRPASQSLGARDCTDCHGDGAPIQFGRISDADDPVASERPVKYMHELRGDEAPLVKAWGLGFEFRPALKWLGLVCAGVIALVLLHYALAGIGAITRRFR